MKRWTGLLVAITICASCLATMPAHAESATAVLTPEPYPVGDVIITSYRFDNSKLSFIQLYNKSSNYVNLDVWQLNVKYRDTDDKLIEVSQSLNGLGWLRPKKHIVLAATNSPVSPWEYVDAELGDLSLEHYAPELVSVSLPGTYETDLTGMSLKNGQQYTLHSTSTGYVTTNLFDAVDGTKKLDAGGVYTYESSTPLRITEVFSNAMPCSPLSNEPHCREFVKLCNVSTTDTILDLYRLRIGSLNSADKITLSGTLTAGQCRPIYEDISSAGGYSWIEDALGIHTYTETVIAYPRMTLARYDGYSWAYDSSANSWGWSRPSPLLATNVLVPEPAETIASDTRVPCKDGQYRSEETGRCRTLALLGDTVTPCKEGQYRSEGTNRCRSLASTVAAALKPCGDDQFRNPSTGRCKKIASSEDILQPCDAGYERNLETNRCRKVKATDMPIAGYPVEPYKQSDTTPLIWWGIGGIAALALGYAGWEWRREIAAHARRLVTIAKK